MRTATLLLLLVFATRAHADAIETHAAPPRTSDRGFYVGASFGYAFPTLTEAGMSDSQRLSGSRVKTWLGYRRGILAIEPTLEIQSIDRADYPMHSDTTIEELAAYGAQLKLVGRGPAAWFARLGPHRTWTNPNISKYREGYGFEGGIGIQLGHREGPLAMGFMLEASYSATWLTADGAPTQRISTQLLSIGFGGGTGF